MKFVKPQIEIIRFDACDVIATSTVTYASAEDALRALGIEGKIRTNNFTYDGASGESFTYGGYTFVAIGNPKNHKWKLAN